MSGWLKWDGEILLWIQEHVLAGGLDGVMRAITHLGDAGAFWILLAAVLLIVKKTRRLGAACASALVWRTWARGCALRSAPCTAPSSRVCAIWKWLRAMC